MKPIVIKNLNHYFGKDKLAKQALFDINFEIRAGEIVIMTGPSGSGKTTLLTLLGGLRRVQSGSLQTLGQELFQAKEEDLVKIRRKIGYIFQAHNLLPFMTAQQNVQMSLELEPKMNSRQAAKIARGMLSEVGLKERIKYFPENLSGGQKQRVAIARALATRPKLVVADEPTAALDSKTGREVVNIMHRLVREQNSTILLVTHDNRILDIADRIIHMEDGRLVNTEKRLGSKKIFHLQDSTRSKYEQHLLPVEASTTVNHHSNNRVLADTETNYQKEYAYQDISIIDLATTQKSNLSLENSNSATSTTLPQLSEVTPSSLPLSKERTYKIVCIDDSVTLLKSIESFLDNKLFNLVTIDNPLDALLETIRNEPDIVLLDIMMPNINGHEFCNLLRQNRKFKKIPIIIMTSLDDTENKKLARDNGASDYLVKPFNKTDLIKILFKYL